MPRRDPRPEPAPGASVRDLPRPRSADKRPNYPGPDLQL